MAKAEPLHLLVPMSGQGTRYQKAGYNQPKPMIPVNGVPMIERLLSHMPSEWPAHFVLAENHLSTSLPALLKKCRPSAVISSVPVHQKGPAVAILEGLKTIPAEAPVLVSYCDYGMVWDARRFEHFVAESGCDACLISYRGFHAHYLNPTTYAFSRLQGERVAEVREKGSFTDNRENEFASCGGYYFRTAQILKSAVESQMKRDLNVNGEYYTSLTVQALLLENPAAHVRVFEIPGFFQWGTPEDLQNFEYWEKTYQAFNRHTGTDMSVDQILMPMAGLGSRFKDLTDTPKPLISVAGRRMFERALTSLPQAKKSVLVTVNSLKEKLDPLIQKNSCEVRYLSSTPSGQALTTEAGVIALGEGDIIISSCDHGLVLDPALWKKFRANPDCDAALFTVRGFPGANRKPAAFAYVRIVDTDTNPFSEIIEVSVKKPISDHPERDPLLVGTFWFRNKTILQKGLRELIQRDTRVNGEIYLDSIMNILKELGHKTRIVPLDGYINWGDPDSLAEALYWQEIFGGHRLDQRPRYPGLA